MPVARPDMNGYRDFEQGHLRTSSYANGYDPYRRDREDFSDYPPPPRRVPASYAGDFPSNRSVAMDAASSRSYRDGYNGRRYNGVDDFEQNSFDAGMRDGTEPTFEVDHLATYSSKSGTTHPEDGLTKLKQMENSTGIWTMRCLLIVDRRFIVIVDKGNGEELERFPMSQVQEPTAVLKNDRRETYNNLVLFTIVEDPRRKNSPSDMHIFQSVNAPAHDIVDEILHAKGEGGGRSKGQYSSRMIPPPPSGPAPEPPYGKFSNYSETHAESYVKDEPIETRLRATRLGDTRIVEPSRFNDGRYGASRAQDYRASYIHKDDMDAGQNEALERNVQLLNNCFDDIEKFVSRLQAAAEAYKELERRRMEQGNRRKTKPGGYGMLSMRAKPPPGEDFVDIFQKFKFAFNLLAKLKAHIHDPNAPELVHFLFTPLSLIYEASRDPIHRGRDLSGEAVSPLLIHDVKQLFVNCLTSKELELWQRLGRAWTTMKDDWTGYAPPYTPRFYNGWQPSTQAVDEINMDRFRDTQGPYTSEYRREEPSYSRELRNTAHDDPYSRDPYSRDIRESRREDSYLRNEEPTYSREIRSPGRDMRSPSPVDDRHENKRSHPPPAKTRAEENMQYAQELKRMGATIYEAVHERQGKNAKELTVEKGDILQVLDKSRNWWKLKNHLGDTGYAPYTILKEYQPSDDFDNGHGRRLSGEYNSYINGNEPPPAPALPPMGHTGRSNTRGGGDKFRYF